MTLESQQFKDDRMKSIIGNTSASNEPIQVTVDANDQLQKLNDEERSSKSVDRRVIDAGSDLIAKLKGDGLTDEQIRKTIDRMNRVQSESAQNKRTGISKASRKGDQARFDREFPQLASSVPDADYKSVEMLKKDVIDPAEDELTAVFGPYQEDTDPDTVYDEKIEYAINPETGEFITRDQPAKTVDGKPAYVRTPGVYVESDKTKTGKGYYVPGDGQLVLDAEGNPIPRITVGEKIKAESRDRKIVKGEFEGSGIRVGRDGKAYRAVPGGEVVEEPIGYSSYGVDPDNDNVVYAASSGDAPGRQATGAALALIEGLTDAEAKTPASQRSATIGERLMSSFSPEGQKIIEAIARGEVSLDTVLQGPSVGRVIPKEKGPRRAPKGPTLTAAERGISPEEAAKPKYQLTAPTVAQALRAQALGNPAQAAIAYNEILGDLERLSSGEVGLNSPVETGRSVAQLRDRLLETSDPAEEFVRMRQAVADMAQSDRENQFGSERSRQTRDRNLDRAVEESERTTRVREFMESLPDIVETRALGPAGALSVDEGSGVAYADPYNAPRGSGGYVQGPSELILLDKGTVNERAILRAPNGVLTRAEDGKYVDEFGNLLEALGPELPPSMREVPRQTPGMNATQFVQTYLPSTTASTFTQATTTGDQRQFREVDINDIMNVVSERITGLQQKVPTGQTNAPYAGIPSTTPTTVQEFDDLIQAIGSSRTLDEKTQKQVDRGFIKDPRGVFGAEEALNELGITTTREREQLANALMQMSLATNEPLVRKPGEPLRTTSGIEIADERGGGSNSSYASMPSTPIEVRTQGRQAFDSSGNPMEDVKGKAVPQVLSRGSGEEGETKRVSRRAAIRQTAEREAAMPYIGALIEDGGEAPVRRLRGEDANLSDDQIREKMKDQALTLEINAVTTELGKRAKARGLKVPRERLRQEAARRVQADPTGLRAREAQMAKNAETAIEVRNRAGSGNQQIVGEVRQRFNEGTSAGQALSVANKINEAGGGAQSARVVPTAGSGAEIANESGSFGPQPIKPLVQGPKQFGTSLDTSTPTYSSGRINVPQTELAREGERRTRRRSSAAPAPSRKDRENEIFNNIKRSLTGRTARRIGRGAVFAGGLASRLNEMQQEEN